MKTLSVKQVAQITCVNIETVRRWIRSGALPADKYPKNSPSGRFYIQEEDIPTYLRKNHE